LKIEGVALTTYLWAEADEVGVENTQGEGGTIKGDRLGCCGSKNNTLKLYQKQTPVPERTFGKTIERGRKATNCEKETGSELKESVGGVKPPAVRKKRGLANSLVVWGKKTIGVGGRGETFVWVYGELSKHSRQCVGPERRTKGVQKGKKGITGNEKYLNKLVSL